MSSLEAFVRQVRARSAENREAMRLLSQSYVPSQMASILRQELDSMIRIIYLLTQSEERRGQLVAASVEGQRWLREDSRAVVTDREMVDLTTNLQGWASLVYKFGNRFIHLSNLHDHQVRDALLQLAPGERSELLDYCRSYHGGPTEENPSFADLVRHLPQVFEKIADNLETYLEMLEDGYVYDPLDL